MNFELSYQVIDMKATQYKRTYVERSENEFITSVIDKGAIRFVIHPIELYS